MKERRKREYENSFQPIVGKAQQLHVRVGEEEVAESSFLVAVKTPINKLGTIVRFIEVFKSPWGVAVNKRGEMIVAESDAGVVSIFSPTGDKPQTLDTKRTVVGEVKNLRGVALDGEDNILVVDRGNHRLLKFSREGDVIAALGSHSDGPIQFSAPYGVCVNSVNGKVYVVDRGTHCVIIINSDLTFSSKFGSYGNGEGQFDSPWDVTSDHNGCVYVADFVNDRVQVFTPDGGYLRQFGKRGNGKGELNGPASTCVNNKGLMYVGESINQRVSVFTCEGVFVKSFGSLGSGPGQFKEPLGIAVDQFGVVYVSDHDNDRVQIFISFVAMPH